MRAVQAPIRVMLCDDSATVRGAMARLLESETDITVVARVGDGRQALAALDGSRPDVVLLDLEMPVMDGMTVLPHLLRGPAPPAVIVASALTQRGAAAAMAALRLGAVDYIPKPTASQGGLLGQMFREEVFAKVRGWTRMRGPRPPAPAAVPPRVAPVATPSSTPGPLLPPSVVVIGSSTGGPQAVTSFVQGLRQNGGPATLGVPFILVQHMPGGFITMLADHLQRLGVLPCQEAANGMRLQPGRLYVAPGDRHLLVESAAHGLVARLSDTAPENFCRPAVDPTLRSLAAACGARALAVILTGMGQDGLAGCRAIAAAGGQVLAQDEASSVVWGMPGAVARAGLARALMPPPELARRVLEMLSPAERRAQTGALRA